MEKVRIGIIGIDDLFGQKPMPCEPLRGKNGRIEMTAHDERDIGVFRFNSHLGIPPARRVYRWLHLGVNARNSVGVKLKIVKGTGGALPPQSEPLCGQKLVQFFAGVKLPGAFGHHFGPTLIARVHSL